MPPATKETDEKPGPSEADRIEKLSGAVARHRRDAEDAQDKLEAAQKEIKALTSERDTYKSQAEAQFDAFKNWSTKSAEAVQDART